MERADALSDFLYECPDGFKFSASIEPRPGGKAWLLLPDRKIELQPELAASGSKYGAEGIVFWIWGNEARLELDGAEHQDCRMENS